MSSSSSTSSLLPNEESSLPPTKTSSSPKPTTTTTKNMFQIKSNKTTKSILSSLYSIKDCLHCPLCNEVMTTPSTLQCSHSFCKDCIEDYTCNSWNCPFPTCQLPVSIRGQNKSYIKLNPQLSSVISSLGNIITCLNSASDYWWKEQPSQSENLLQEEQQEEGDNNNNIGTEQVTNNNNNNDSPFSVSNRKRKDNDKDDNNDDDDITHIWSSSPMMLLSQQQQQGKQGQSTSLLFSLSSTQSPTTISTTIPIRKKQKTIRLSDTVENIPFISSPYYHDDDDDDVVEEKKDNNSDEKVDDEEDDFVDLNTIEDKNQNIPNINNNIDDEEEDQTQPYSIHDDDNNDNSDDDDNIIEEIDEDADETQQYVVDDSTQPYSFLEEDTNQEVQAIPQAQREQNEVPSDYGMNCVDIQQDSDDDNEEESLQSQEMISFRHNNDDEFDPSPPTVQLKVTTNESCNIPTENSPKLSPIAYMESQNVSLVAVSGDGNNGTSKPTLNAVNKVGTNTLFPTGVIQECNKEVSFMDLFKCLLHYVDNSSSEAQLNCNNKLLQGYCIYLVRNNDCDEEGENKTYDDNIDLNAFNKGRICLLLKLCGADVKDMSSLLKKKTSMSDEVTFDESKTRAEIMSLILVSDSSLSLSSRQALEVTLQQIKDGKEDGSIPIVHQRWLFDSIIDFRVKQIENYLM